MGNSIASEKTMRELYLRPFEFQVASYRFSNKFPMKHSKRLLSPHGAIMMYQKCKGADQMIDDWSMVRGWCAAAHGGPGK